MAQTRVALVTGGGAGQGDRHVGHIVAMLTSEAASSVNGQAIPIDGGMVMK